MDSEHKEILYLERAGNELDLARAVFVISTDVPIKRELELKEDASFFSNVISMAYYCIFYSAKALLMSKGVETLPPDEHKKTLDEFEKLVLSGEIDVELLHIYKAVVMKADLLLHIFKLEKSKRGAFTYKKLPQANREPAEDSIHHAEKFFKNMNIMVKKVIA